MFSVYDFKIKKSELSHPLPPSPKCWDAAGPSIAAAGALPTRRRPLCSAAGCTGAGLGVRSQLSTCRKRGTHRPGPQRRQLRGAGAATAHLGARRFAMQPPRDARPALGFEATPWLCRARRCGRGRCWGSREGAPSHCPRTPPAREAHSLLPQGTAPKQGASVLWPLLWAEPLAGAPQASVAVKLSAGAAVSLEGHWGAGSQRGHGSCDSHPGGDACCLPPPIGAVSWGAGSRATRRPLPARSEHLSGFPSF